MKLRLDQYLVQKAYFKSRSQAQYAINLGQITVNGIKASKSSIQVSYQDLISINGQKIYVSRSALKLKAALKKFQINVHSKVIIDAGASTGGFTQVLLEEGALRIYAVDVGTEQLDNILVNDHRIVNLDKCHINDLNPSLLNPFPNMIVADLSFISIENCFDSLAQLSTDREILYLLKPQFEVGRDSHNFKGVVKASEDHIKAIIKAMKVVDGRGYNLSKIMVSPIMGKEGNREFMLYLVDKQAAEGISEDMIVEIVTTLMH